MKDTIFYGVGTAVVTPFDKDYNVDYKSMAKILEYQLEKGADAIVVCGTTGEASTLTYEERIKIISFTVEAVKGKIPVIAGVGSNNYATTLRLMADAESLGVDAFLIVTPYYNKTTQEGIVEIFRGYSNATEKPIIVYDVPSRTGLRVESETYYKMSKLKNVCAVKEACSDMATFAKSVKLCKDISFYSGNDDLVLPALSLGAKGVISVASNLIPEKMSTLCKSYFKKDLATAKNIQLEILDLVGELFGVVNPIPVKYAMSKIGLCKNYLRLPLITLDKGRMEKMDKILAEYNLI